MLDLIRNQRSNFGHQEKREEHPDPQASCLWAVGKFS